MTKSKVKIGEQAIIQESHLQALLGAMAKNGYKVIGPTVRDGAVVYDELESVGDLPRGWSDQQEPAHYRLKRNGTDSYFGFASTPQSWKRNLFLPQAVLWQAKKADGNFAVAVESGVIQKTAFLGVRPCELKAIAIQDKVFLQGEYVDPDYKARRQSLFLLAVNCTNPSGTCFCVSMQTGPRAESGFDLSLTEIIDKEKHYFVVEIGTDLGVQILSDVPLDPITEESRKAAEMVLKKAAGNMGRILDTTEIKALLYQNSENPRWEDVASRCLSCANCTMVCPTCFCAGIEDFTDLSGSTAERRRRWDSCFTIDHSYIHGGSVRTSPKSRYRQWLTHKLASWIDQFGMSGCVGCGRCITWCPVGIDITEEVGAIRKRASAKTAAV